MLIGAIGILALWLVLEAFPRSHHRVLPGDSFQLNEGCAYTTSIPAPAWSPLVEFVGDGGANPQASRLRLYENGKEMGPSHAAHDQIRRQGGGAYSHWGSDLFFSASDCSAPTGNGREYAVSVPATPSSLVRAAGGLASLLLAILLVPAGWRGLKGIIAAWTTRARATDPRANLRRVAAVIVRGDRPRKVLSVTALAISVVWLALELVPFSGHIDIPASQIQPDTGCAYTFSVPRAAGWPLTAYEGDGEGSWQRSGLRLFENGAEPGPAHASHADIRENGKGRYSHWGSVLYFSASDCSNPLTNGRVYSAELPVAPSVAMRIAGGSALLATFILWWLRSAASSKAYLRDLAGLSLLGAVMPSNKLDSPLRFFLLAVFLAGCGLLYLVYRWSFGQTVSLAVGGMHQISDASGYWICANSLLDFGTFGNEKSSVLEWCQRRSIYPSWLSGVVALSGRTIYGTLLIQMAIVSTALALLVRQGIRLTGWGGGILISALFLAYFAEDAWALTMTENAGLAFGLAGFAFLLRAAESRSLSWLLFGCAFVSIALNARAGAFLVLPMLVIWALLAARIWEQRMLTWGVVAVAGCAVGFLLQFLLVWAVGGEPGRSHGNFSYVLYGLSVGGKGWSQVLIDHPELYETVSDGMRAKLIYGWAFSNILADPWLLISAFFKNLLIHLQVGAFGYDIPLRLSQFATFLWYVSWIPLWQQRRDPIHLLVGLAACGVLLSAPILAMDGGPRIFAATLAVDAVQMGVGLVWLVSVLVNKIHKPAGGVPRLAGQSARPEAVFAGVLMLVLAIPFAYRLLPQEAAAAPNASCKPGEYAFITRIGYESLLLDLTDPGARADFMKGQVVRTDFVKGMPVGAWYAQGTDTLTAKSILLGQQLDRSDINAPGPYRVLSDSSLSPYHGKRVHICVSGEYALDLFGSKYRKLESIEVIK